MNEDTRENFTPTSSWNIQHREVPTSPRIFRPPQAMYQDRPPSSQYPPGLPPPLLPPREPLNRPSYARLSLPQMRPPQQWPQRQQRPQLQQAPLQRPQLKQPRLPPQLQRLSFKPPLQQPPLQQPSLQQPRLQQPPLHQPPLQQSPQQNPVSQHPMTPHHTTQLPSLPPPWPPQMHHSRLPPVQPPQFARPTPQLLFTPRLPMPPYSNEDSFRIPQRTDNHRPQLSNTPTLYTNSDCCPEQISFNGPGPPVRPPIQTYRPPPQNDFSKLSYQPTNAGQSRDVPHKNIDPKLCADEFLRSHENLLALGSKKVESIEGDDTAWVKFFMQNVVPTEKEKPDSGRNKMTISGFQACLRECIQLKVQARETMDLLRSTEDEGELCSQTDVVKHLVAELKRVTEIVSDPQTQETVDKLVQQRKRKRARLKRKRLALYEEKLSSLERREEKHKVIDSRMEEVAQSQLTLKQDREMKEHADTIKGEVRKKLAETERTMELLRSVRKLRKVRLHSVVSRGINANPAQSEQFEEKIDEFMEVMARQKAVYDNETKTLEVMLGREQAETKDKEMDRMKVRDQERFKKQYNKIHAQLFGKHGVCEAAMAPYLQYYTQAESSLESLVTIRSDWDSYLVDPATPWASRVPDGWVQPELPSDKHWALCLDS